MPLCGHRGLLASACNPELCRALWPRLWRPAPCLLLFTLPPIPPVAKFWGKKIWSVQTGIHMLYFSYISGGAEHLQDLCTAVINTAKKWHGKLGCVSQLRQFQNKWRNSTGLMLQSSLLDCCGRPAEARSGAFAAYLSLGFGFFLKRQIKGERKG